MVQLSRKKMSLSLFDSDKLLQFFFCLNLCLRHENP